jgi:PhoH-like ATPase
MSRKAFVIDTNVLLYDPESIKKFKDSDVILPLIVLEELDAMKRFSDELGKNARQVMRYLDSLSSVKNNLYSGVSLDYGITLRIYLEPLADPIARSAFPLPLDKNDNKILYAAFQLKKQGETVILVSKDVVVRVKAEAIDLPAEDYENLKTSFDTIYKGYREVELDKRSIDLFYKDRSLPLDLDDLFPNEYCFLRCKEMSSAMGKYNAKTRVLEPLLSLQRSIWGIHPLNAQQQCALDLLLRDDIKLVTLLGPAGTGKTLLALAAGLKKVFDDAVYTRILISRPIVPLGKDIGYLPGTKEEKLYHWMQPIYDNLEFLCESSTGASDGKETQKWILESKKIEMEAVTYIRGRSLPKMFMIIDEAQNLTPHEVKTIISRAGQGTKVVLTGDPTQIDNPYLDKDSNGLTFVVGKLRNRSLFGHIFLERTERSELAALAAEIL